MEIHKGSLDDVQCRAACTVREGLLSTCAVSLILVQK